MENQTKKPTLQDAISIYNFLESLKWNHDKNNDTLEVISARLQQNKSISDLQIGIHNWIIDYTKEHFDYDKQMMGGNKDGR